jgi:type II secretory pathway component PulC
MGLRPAEPGSAPYPAEWSAAMLGLRAGDVVTALNGFALRRPEDAMRAQGQLPAVRGAVVELVRDGQPVVLRVDWER